MDMLVIYQICHIVEAIVLKILIFNVWIKHSFRKVIFNKKAQPRKWIQQERQKLWVVMVKNKKILSVWKINILKIQK
jgi:hypothetical protein